MVALNKYIEDRLENGYQYFILDELKKNLKLTNKQIQNSIYYFTKKKDITRVIQGLYIIISPENRYINCLPPEELIPIIMKYSNTNYYVSLLSACEYYGAAHQKPMIFQVTTNKRFKNIKCGSVRINFIYKKNIDKVPTQNITVKTGILKVSTPEATAIDLLHYIEKSVGMNNIATILSELIEVIKTSELIKLADQLKEKAWIQRMGYILDNIDTLEEEKQKGISNALYKYLSAKKLNYTALSSRNEIKGFSRNKKWKIIENTKIESDL